MKSFLEHLAEDQSDEFARYTHKKRELNQRLSMIHAQLRELERQWTMKKKKQTMRTNR